MPGSEESPAAVDFAACEVMLVLVVVMMLRPNKQGLNDWSDTLIPRFAPAVKQTR